MKVENGKLYQDPLYGAKVLSPLAVAIVDTPEFQRLAELRQLGFADVTYRGARHSRFEHSVGTYFLTRTLLRRIVQNHERLNLDHPGKHVSSHFRHVPSNSDLPDGTTTYQARWRGLAEAVSAAALMHDLGHVPFGHTLEDEMAGIYNRHDSVAGPRLYEMMFNKSSELRQVFFNSTERWVGKISNEDLARLIYVILNWKETIDPQRTFDDILERELEGAKRDKVHSGRLSDLKEWHQRFRAQGLFHPFMSDVIGNTICADILDYLPRDRKNLGMEFRFHTRLQRYFTVREGTLYPNEGLRVSIMVTRKGRGGQRRDVATAVLDIMRERYEMAERVFYHHKKAAASAMLAKLVELAGDAKPRDGVAIYPAPWQHALESAQQAALPTVPHMVHLSDAELINYVGTIPFDSEETRTLQRTLHSALRWRRKGYYRTLLVIDTDVPPASKHPISFYANELRGPEGHATNKGRIALESKLANACGAVDGEVLLYCPSPEMQSKEVDVRLEITENRVLPLRVQTESFAYCQDIEVLKQYYKGLWRIYVFVSPRIFEDETKCKTVVDTLCEHYGIPQSLLYRKVRNYEFRTADVAPPVKERAEGDFVLRERLAQLDGALIVSCGCELPATIAKGVREWATPRLAGLEQDEHLSFLTLIPSKMSFNRATAEASGELTRLVSVLDKALRTAKRRSKEGRANPEDAQQLASGPTSDGVVVG